MSIITINDIIKNKSSQTNLKNIDFIKIFISEHLIQIIISIKNPITFSKYTTIFISTFKKNNFEKYDFDYNEYKYNFDLFIEFINCYIKSANLTEIFINTNNLKNHSILFDFLNIKFFVDVIIILGRDFDYPIDLCIYDNIRTIYLRGKSKKNLLYLPKNLMNLHLAKYHHPDANLPQVKNLYLHKSYNQKINLNNTNITSVIFGKGFNKIVSFDSTNIKSLEFNNSYNCMLEQIPYSIETIKINCNNYNLELDYLPNSIKELEIKSNLFNKNLDNLPNSIIKLTLHISDKYSYPLSNLPNSIEELTISKNLITNMNKLPNSLKILNIKNTYYDIDKNNNKLKKAINIFIDKNNNKLKKAINILLENFDENYKPQITYY